MYVYTEILYFFGWHDDATYRINLGCSTLPVGTPTIPQVRLSEIEDSIETG